VSFLTGGCRGLKPNAPIPTTATSEPKIPGPRRQCSVPSTLHRTSSRRRTVYWSLPPRGLAALIYFTLPLSPAITGEDDAADGQQGEGGWFGDDCTQKGRPILDVIQFNPATSIPQLDGNNSAPIKSWMPKNRSSTVAPENAPSAIVTGPIVPRDTIPEPKASKVVVPAPSTQTIPAAVTGAGQVNMTPVEPGLKNHEWPSIAPLFPELFINPSSASTESVEIEGKGDRGPTVKNPLDAVIPKSNEPSPKI